MLSKNPFEMGDNFGCRGSVYTIDQLESITIYTVTVTASNAAGIMTDSQSIIVSTGEFFFFPPLWSV